MGVLFLVQIRYFPLFKERFFVRFDPIFRFPKTYFFPVSTLFFSPQKTPVYYSRNTSLLFTKHPPEKEKSTTKWEASTTHTSKESYA